MARTPSNMLALGTKAPNFSLIDTISGNLLNYDDVKGENGTVIAFICNHCPFVKHINQELVDVASQYMPKGFGFVAISSNDVENYPDDRPELMKKTAQKEYYPFAYLYDESQEVAKAYDAACTPDFYIFNSQKKLVYRGQLDDSRPENGIPTSGKDIREALDALLLNKPINPNQKPSIGCNIKWKK